MASPYPWHYDLRWPWLHLRPSLRAHVELPRRPLAAHAVGKKLDATMPAGTPGAGARRGLVHAVAIRDDHAGLTVLRTA